MAGMGRLDIGDSCSVSQRSLLRQGGDEVYLGVALDHAVG
jgi:hypothetical protein